MFQRAGSSRLHLSMEQYLPVPAAVLTAIQTGDIEQLKSLYNPDIELETIARYAAKENQAQVLEWCYCQGWTPSTDDLNEPFFIAAICNPSIEFWQVLLNHGYDMNAHTTETLGDALASAVMFGEHDFAKWLLQHGHKVNPREPTIQPECSITRAVRGDAASIDMLRALLDHGFELAEYRAATAAVEEDNVEALKLLLAHGGFDVDEVIMWWYPFDDERDEPTDSEGTALYRACRQGHVECAQLLLEHGADPRAKDLGGVSCLEIAKERGHEEIVGLLRFKGLRR